MDELDSKLKDFIKEDTMAFEIDDRLNKLKQILKDAGYIHLPASQGKNVTIYTSDNDEPLLTEAEWREKYGG